ncbi:MAG: DUF222 domain-containing protein [Acidimicrobiales bacterium]|nr:DUF222 domain-containing protein [Acidimicrobiales bacterium]
MSEHPAVLVRQLGEVLDGLAGVDWALVDPGSAAEVLVGLMGAGSKLDAVTAAVAGRVEASRVWAEDGSKSASAWLGRAAGRDRAETKGVFGRARALRDMPGTAAAHEAGELSARHVRLLARAQRINPEVFAGDDEAWLVAQAQVLGFDDFAKVVDYWCQCAAPDEVEDQARARYEARRARLTTGLDGMGHLEVDLDPVAHGLFAEALARIEQELWETDWAEARDRLGVDATKADLARSDAQRRHDALVEMARRSAATPAGARKPVPLITVHIDHDTLAGRVCELSTGQVLTPGEVLPLLSEADIERAVFDTPSRLVDLGEQARFFVGGTRRAVQICQPQCVHNTCEVPAERCDVHHIEAWPAGPTTQANGEPRCPAHHPGRRRTDKARRRRSGRGSKTDSSADGDDDGDGEADQPGS